MIKVKWIFNDGLKAMPYDSFPFAYRAMYQTLKQGVEKGRKYADMIKCMSVVGPVATGAKSSTYSYAAATEKAKDAGIITTEGQLNSREFRRP